MNHSSLSFNILYFGYFFSPHTSNVCWLFPVGTHRVKEGAALCETLVRTRRLCVMCNKKTKYVV